MSARTPALVYVSLSELGKEKSVNSHSSRSQVVQRTLYVIIHMTNINIAG